MKLVKQNNTMLHAMYKQLSKLSPQMQGTGAPIEVVELGEEENVPPGDQHYRDLLPITNRKELMEHIKDKQLMDYVRRQNSDLDGGTLIEGILTTLLGVAK